MIQYYQPTMQLTRLQVKEKTRAKAVEYTLYNAMKCLKFHRQDGIFIPFIEMPS